MNQESKIDIVVLKTIGKTLFAIFVVIGFIFASLCSINPKAASNYATNIARASLLEKTYYKTNKITDLYNAIEANLETEKYFTSGKLIKIMKTREDYASFCSKINESAIKQTTDKSRLVLVADYDGYLNSQLVISYYNSHAKDDAREYAIKAFIGNANVYDWCFGTYVDCIMLDKALSQEARQQILNELYTRKYNNVIIEEIIGNNIDMLGDPETLTGLEKCLAYYQMIKIRKTQRILMNANGQDITDITADISALVNKYEDSLIEL